MAAGAGSDRTPKAGVAGSNPAGGTDHGEETWNACTRSTSTPRNSPTRVAPGPRTCGLSGGLNRRSIRGGPLTSIGVCRPPDQSCESPGRCQCAVTTLSFAVCRRKASSHRLAMATVANVFRTRCAGWPRSFAAGSSGARELGSSGARELGSSASELHGSRLPAAHRQRPDPRPEPPVRNHRGHRRRHRESGMQGTRPPGFKGEMLFVCRVPKEVEVTPWAFRVRPHQLQRTRDAAPAKGRGTVHFGAKVMNSFRPLCGGRARAGVRQGATGPHRAPHPQEEP